MRKRDKDATATSSVKFAVQGGIQICYLVETRRFRPEFITYYINYRNSIEIFMNCHSGKDDNRVAAVRKPTRPRVISLEAIDSKSIEEDDDELENLCSYCNVMLSTLIKKNYVINFALHVVLKIQVGAVEKNFTFAGILLCFICFPCGFAWLFYLREEQCNNCGKMYH